MNVEQYIAQIPVLISAYGIKIILALVIFFVGKWLAKTISKFIEGSMAKKSVDVTLSNFITNIIYYLILAFVIIAALSQVGIQTASLIAVLGAAGLAVGLALQGSLSNFAAGVMIILFKPCKTGDFIEAGGAMGTISEIGIFATILLTPDNKTIIVPNSNITGGNITNFSTQEERRVDLVVGVGYGSDIKQVKEVLAELVAADSRILTDKETMIAVSELADSSVNFVLRPWVKASDYWGVYFDLTEAVKVRFDELGIEIPFPQMDVHVTKSGE
ncbi:mechanosensitive ion channel family protein [Sessilibacter corallicola]|uniref:Small-conductance mechanosensitive channel n=1 Tax=Sessilibacter corallicola TaxID=2904075 RepID=A0ABQ0A404_9GAMM